MEQISVREAEGGCGRADDREFPGAETGPGKDRREKKGDGSYAFSASPGESGGLLLVWEKIPGALHYNLYRSREGGNWRFAVQTEEDRYLDSQVKGGDAYVYKLKYTFDGKRYHEFPEQAAGRAPLEKYRNANSGRLWERGAESEAVGRPLPIHLAKSMLAFDVVSFDVFDTLILRPFSEPSDLFILVGEELGIMDFCEIRKKAEEDARRRSEFLRGSREVTLYDIYEMVEEETGVEAVSGARTEFLTERKLCFANPYMLEVFRMVKARGKTVVAVSDMYLPRELMEELLRSCGYEGFDDILVSCDYSCTKRKGGLFDILRKKYRGVIFHVGDHPRSDVEAARERGIEAVQECERGRKALPGKGYVPPGGQRLPGRRQREAPQRQRPVHTLVRGGLCVHRAVLYGILPLDHGAGQGTRAGEDPVSGKRGGSVPEGVLPDVPGFPHSLCALVQNSRGEDYCELEQASLSSPDHPPQGRGSLQVQAGNPF